MTASRFVVVIDPLLSENQLMRRRVPRRQRGFLTAVAKSRQLAKVKDELARGSDVDEIDTDGRTSLLHATVVGDVEIAQALLAAGADVRRADRRGYTALHFAAQEYRPEMVEMLVRTGALLEAEDADGNTPLMQAAYYSRGRGDVIGLLRRLGADLDHASRHGVSPRSLAETIANYDVNQWMK